MSQYKITEDERKQVDGTQLVDEIGIDAGEINWRKEFTQFDEGDEARLAEMSAIFDEVAEQADRVQNKIEEVSNATKEQTGTVEDIGETLDGLTVRK